MSDREEYQQQLEDQLAGWQADLLHLKDMTAEEHGNIHPEMKQRIREFERRIAAAKRRLPKLMAASEEEWEAKKAAFESAVFRANVPKSKP
jgi:hypothetical protein